MTASHARTALLCFVVSIASAAACGDGAVDPLDGGGAIDAVVPMEDAPGEDAYLAPPDASAAIDAGPPVHCGDGSRSGDETDDDCGGSCAPCATGESCGAARDCATGRCLALRCGTDAFDVGVAPLPTARGYLAAARGLDGRVYTFGGISPSASGVDDRVEIYSVELDAWTNGAPIPTPRYGAVAVTATDGRIYLAGGDYDGDTFTWGNSIVVESYDPVSDTWRTEPSLPSGRTYAAGVSWEGRITMIGGFDVEASAAQTDVVSLAPGETEWRVEPRRITVGRSSLAAATVGETIVVAGGNDGMSRSTVEVFDGTAWYTRAPLPTGRQLLAAAASGERVYTFGGANGSGAVVEGYDVATNTWFTARDLPSERSGAAAVTLADGSILVIGGITGVVATATQSVVRYRP